eukprot:286185_1
MIHAHKIKLHKRRHAYLTTQRTSESIFPALTAQQYHKHLNLFSHSNPFSQNNNTTNIQISFPIQISSLDGSSSLYAATKYKSLFPFKFLALYRLFVCKDTK